MSEIVKRITNERNVTSHTSSEQFVPWYRSRSFLIVCALVLLLAASWTYMFLNGQTHKTLDQRVYEVGSQLKCPVCQGESVADSPSTLAQQMRGIIRQQLQEGKSEQQVIQYFVDSYGTQIVWSPPWQGFALLAWLVPIALLLGGTVLIFFVFRDWRLVASVARDEGNNIDAEVEINEEELEHYRQLLEEELGADDPLFSQKQKETR
jgi:cytochrome c-type biogenesis protein CcmH